MKYIRFLITLLFVILGSCISVFAEENITEEDYNYAPVEIEYVLGSLDGNTDINAADALIVLKHSAKIESINELLLSYADVNYDEQINAADALEILKYSAKIIERFPYRAEEGIEILKNYIIENGADNNGESYYHEFDINSLLEKELEAVGDSTLDSLFSEIDTWTTITYNNDSRKFEFAYSVSVEGIENKIAFIFNEKNTASSYSMDVVIEDEEISVSYSISSNAEFTNANITESTDFDNEVEFKGDILELMTEEELAEYATEMNDSVDTCIHAGLIVLNQLLEEYVDINLKDIGFTNYNVSVESLLNGVL